jgi:recombination protein RecA
MAPGKKKDKIVASDVSSGKGGSSNEEDLSGELIKALNKEFGTRVAYNLSTDESPTHVKRWIPSGSTLLDLAISNRRDGGYPEGRIIELAGMPSTGKTHLACAAGCAVQAMGGLVVYAETENAIMPSHLEDLGLDIGRRFVYADPSHTEDVFKLAEETIVKTRAAVERRGMPILFVWDSVAATSPKAELDGDYDQNTVGLQARTISKCMRKITGIVGSNNVTFMALNQLRMKIGVLYGDPLVTPGGNAIPFHASVRVRLSSGARLVDPKTKDQYGIRVIATVIKNKVARPNRKVEFEIHFGKGIVEHEQILDICRVHCKKGPVVRADKALVIEGDGGWKTLSVSSDKTGEVLLEKKFQKGDFEELARDPAYGPFVDEILVDAMTSGGTTSGGDEPGEDEQAAEPEAEPSSDE